MSTTKIGENTINILKLLFFTINLHFATSNQVHTYKKLISPVRSSICFIFLPPEMQKRESSKMRALRAKNVLTYRQALHTYVLTCLRVLRAYVLMCKRATLNKFNWYIIQIY